jgi:mono/diheme cytochrome c family protein
MRAIAGFLGLVLSISAAAADAEPARSEGEQLAQSVCSACHTVAAQQDRPPILRGVANFCEIANRPDTTAHSLAHFVTHTHWDRNSVSYTMPDLMLNAQEAKAVSQYILGLRGKCDFSGAPPPPK